MIPKSKLRMGNVFINGNGSVDPSTTFGDISHDCLALHHLIAEVSAHPDGAAIMAAADQRMSAAGAA